ncbi:MAG: hypothetical protein SNJ64_00535 [Endomicrobiia bacterium]
MKKFFVIPILLILTLMTCSLFAVTIVSYGVDGSSGNTNVVVKSRNPIIFWEYNGVVSEYIVSVSSFSRGLLSGTTVWSVIGSTTTTNTINNITRIECNYSNFLEKEEYFFSITLNSTTTVFGSFKTSPSAIKFSSPKIDFDIDENNPFCPKQNETTSFRYIVRDKDLNVKIYIFTISGKFVLKLADHPALKDVVYTQKWDGKDEQGNVLSEGMYVATIVAGDYIPISKFVGIIDRR